MTTVEIQYCVPCGHLGMAQDLQESILEEFGQRVDTVTLRTGDSGVFTVHVDGDLVFDKSEDAYDEGEILDAVTDRVSATQ